jgi:ribosomal peptide maturation radical SAM protein 1
MMKKVLLISMPFASVRYPSAALSLLKSLLKREGVSCNVAYLNIFFQAYIGSPDIYEAIANLIMVGEWVFSEELFGEQWARSDRRKVEALDAPLLSDELKRKGILESIDHLRSMAQPFVRECLERVKWDDYSIIGFTSVFSQHVASLALARHIKQRWPDKIIAFGGANCEEEMGKALLRLFPFVDWVFNGEADLSFSQAVTQWFAGRPPAGIPGVTYRDDSQIIEQNSGLSPEMNSLPYPNFEEYFMALKKWSPACLRSAPISLELSRGCWWGKKAQCIFCGLNCKTLNFRRKSPQRAEDEIKALTARYKVDRVILTDSILDMSFFKTLLPALADWGGLEELFLEAKVNLNRDQMLTLKSAGVKFFQPGIESLDSEILAHMRKGTTLLQNVQFLKWAQEYGVYPTWNLLYGFPGENAEAYQRMALLVPSIVHLCPPLDVSPVLLVRFSPLFEQNQEWGLKNIRAHAGYRSFYPFTQEDLDELAYFFDYDFDGKDFIPGYIDPLKHEVQDWKQCWKQPRPPMLTFDQQPGGKVVIYDTRTPGQSHREELEGEKAMAIVACDAIRQFDSLVKEIYAKSSKKLSDTAALKCHLDELVARRFMLREGDQYLSLAMKPGLKMDVSEEW